MPACPNCGEENPEHARVCSSCGAGASLETEYRSTGRQAQLGAQPALERVDNLLAQLSSRTG